MHRWKFREMMSAAQLWDRSVSSASTVIISIWAKLKLLWITQKRSFKRQHHLFWIAECCILILILTHPIKNLLTVSMTFHCIWNGMFANNLNIDHVKRFVKIISDLIRNDGSLIVRKGYVNENVWVTNLCVNNFLQMGNKQSFQGFQVSQVRVQSKPSKVKKFSAQHVKTTALWRSANVCPDPICVLCHRLRGVRNTRSRLKRAQNLFIHRCHSYRFLSSKFKKGIPETCQRREWYVWVFNLMVHC